MKGNSELLYIVIPAFNEANALADVIKDIRQENFKEIIVVDDGSLDNTYEIAKKEGCIAIQHNINRGKGAATQTGLDAARLLGADIVVTMDGDGQHFPEDARALVDALRKSKSDVVIGSRLLMKDGLPLSRRVMNIIGNIVTYLFYGVYVSDSQSGFRAYNRKSLKSINSNMDRYEFESDSLSQLKSANCKISEIPIRVKYTEHSKNKYNGLAVPSQNLLNGFKMLYRMLIRAIFA